MAKRKGGEQEAGSHAPSIAAIIPCHRERGHVLDVIAGIGPEVSGIFVVDDACPDGTGDFVERECADERVRVIRHTRNKGVGGAMLTGYRHALDEGFDVLVKLDGDGQMDPDLIPVMAAPVVAGRADYAKGNRFHRVNSVVGMPAFRIIGNIGLSFLSKLSSGYWNIFDPTNGYTELHAEAAKQLPFEAISSGYFFESDMLFHLGLIRAVVEDVPMKARYGAETSGLNIYGVIPQFLVKHYVNTCKRIFYTYFLRDTGAATFNLVFGKILLLFGLVFGTFQWYESYATGVPATSGTVVLAALPVIIGTQFLIAFLGHDTRNIPKTPVQNAQVLEFD